MENYTAQNLINELIIRIEESSVVISPSSIDRLVALLTDVDCSELVNLFDRVV